jgi:hypothetical protein
MSDPDRATRGWNARLRDQVDVHYRPMFGPRMAGLTDAEYLWEPVPGAWSVRPRCTSTSAAPIGAGDLVRDDAAGEPEPAPVTTIAWRVAHLTVECLSMRTMSHLGGPAVHWETWEHTDRADEGLAQLDTAYDAWSAGVESLGYDGLLWPCGPAEGPFAEAVRDLYRATTEESR